MDGRGGTLKQSLLARLGENIPSILGGRVVLKGEESLKKRNRGLDPGKYIEGNKSYDKSEEIRNYRD